MYDLIIIGAGPAGITASVYAARKRMNFLVVTKDIGGQTAWSGDIENYTGYQFISGPELTAKFEEHMRTYKIPVNEGEEALEVALRGGAVAVRTDKASYEAKTAIIASGKKARELGVPGEKEFKNKGVTYCATCDGPLFAGKEVAVVGGGNSALDAALQLLKIAKKVHLITNADRLTGDAIMQEKFIANPLASAHYKTAVSEIIGNKFVEAVKIKGEGKEATIPVQGIFIEIGLTVNTAFIQSVEKNERGEIKVNCHNETSLLGIFAAGDVTDVPEKQIIIAAGEGAKAALSAFRYLSRLR